MKTMTPRQRWMSQFTGETPDRLPCCYWATPEVTGRLKKELGVESDRALWKRLGVDKLIGVTATVENPHPDSGDVWHIERERVSYGDGIGVYAEAVGHPLDHVETVADVENFGWPDPDWWDVSTVRERAGEWEGHPILGGGYEPFMLYCNMRGMEQAFEDLMLKPDVAEAILERIFQIHYAVIKKTLEEAADLVDFIYVAEDLGTQDSLLMSPASFRRFLKPRMVKMIELAHSYDVKAFHHDDGAIRPLLPELFDMGIDVLNPIQWRCPGMEREGLARDFGDRVVFHGAVDNQHTLPFGSADDVRGEVRENIEIFGKCRGYIIAPCHNIQPNTPTENILALYEAVEKYGRRGGGPAGGAG